MSLSTILNQMTNESMKDFAGKRRCKGAKKKEQYVFAVQLTLGMRGEAGLADLPAEVQKKVQDSKSALAELQRIKLACGECATWDELKRVLSFFPPSVLLTILLEEMTAEQMKALAGQTRCEGATRKDQFVFGVLLTLAEDAARVQRLPANARRRIDAAPGALQWTEMVRERAKKEVLQKVKGWRGFLEMLCEPPPDDEDEDDEDEAAEDEAEEEEEAPATAATDAVTRSASAEAAGKATPTKLEAKLDAVADAPAAPTPPSGGRRVALWCHEHAFLSLPAVLMLNAAASYANANVGVAAYVASTAAVGLLALADVLVL